MLIVHIILNFTETFVLTSTYFNDNRQ